MELFLSTWLLFQKVQPDPCEFEVKTSGLLQVQRMRYGDSQQCVIIVNENNKKSKWRSYNYFESGLFLIFLNFGSGSQATDTGSKTYYFFPRQKTPTYQFTKNQLLVSDASGVIHTFSTRTGQPISISDSKIDVSSNISPSNKGGFQIISHKGLYLDNGFNLGELPYVDPETPSLFKNTDLECSVLNKELFKYTYKTDPDGTKYLDSVDFKLTDSAVTNLLVQRCNF